MSKHTALALAPPPRQLTWLEPLSVLELPRLLLAAPQLRQLPRGDGSPVLVTPGYGTSDRSTALLRAFLNWLGYQTYPWGLGKNTGDVPKLVEKLQPALANISKQHNKPVHLIGWSLGGVLMRELARDNPQLAQQVITLGTPVVGGPKYTVTAKAYREKGYDLDEIEAGIAAREAKPISVPVLSIYSKRDGVVGWQASLDQNSLAVSHQQVQARHMGLGISPEVFSIIAKRLAEQPRA